MIQLISQAVPSRENACSQRVCGTDVRPGEAGSTRYWAKAHRDGFDPNARQVRRIEKRVSFTIGTKLCHVATGAAPETRS